MTAEYENDGLPRLYYIFAWTRMASVSLRRQYCSMFDPVSDLWMSSGCLI